MLRTNRGWTSPIGVALAAAVALAGCSDQSVPYAKPGFGFFKKYSKAQNSAAVLLSNAAWWQGMKNPSLDRLINLALAQNLDLKLARERVIAARAARDTVPGQAILSPSTQARTSGSNTTERNTVANASLGLNWMLDPYGARRNELRAAGARIEVAEAEVDAAQLLVLLNTANAYTNLRHAQHTLRQREEELARRQSTLRLTRRLSEAEAATRLDITRSRARVSEIRAQLPALKANVTAFHNELAVLVGRAPGALPPDLAQKLQAGGEQPHPHMSPDVGIPADLLRNRPDIHIAEREYYAAVAEIAVARADLYPRLSLTGAITLNALGGRSSASEYFFGPVVNFPNLPTKPARAAVAARHSAARQAHTSWKTTVLGAILEVENALVAYRGADVSLTSARQARRLYGEALTLTRRVFREGEATLGDLIDAEEALAQSDRALIDLRQQHALRFIALNVRLGAGHKASAR